jgi:oligosaccharide reducing-end xylanase
MKKYTILTLVMLVLLSTCRVDSGTELFYEGNGNGIDLDDEIIDNGSSSEEPSDPSDPSDPTDIKIKIVMSGIVESDNVTSLSEYSKAGEEITLNYILSDTKENNRITFSGTDPAIDEVDGAGIGFRKYVIAENDAIEGVITINAMFTHTDKQFNTIAFADTSNEEVVYGDTLTKAIKNTGYGFGVISYVSSDTSVASVSSYGEVTIRKVGTVTITATKAGDAVYEKAQAKYTLTVTPLQLTIASPTTKPKVYDGTTNADVTIGALTNKVKGDTVNVTAAANFNSADVSNANIITVVYTIAGESADNYVKPDDSVIAGVISKAPGVAVNGNPSVQTKTASSITSSVVMAPGEQSVEYAIAATTAVPTSGWQDERFFGGLTPSTDYYLFARAKESDNYLTGTAKRSSKITTEAPNVTIKISLTGNDTGDSVTATPMSGKAGEEITLNYTLANIKANNRLAFSGTTTAIAAVNSAGSGTRKYIINEEDAVQNIITINAAFSHAALVLDTIAFENTSNEEKVYGDAVFTKAITNTGSGSGAITYSSDNAGVATVNNTTGAVTIVKVGTTTITATKAADANYAQATASYTLTVTKLQLTIADPTVTTTKVYKSGDTTAAVTAGALTNKVGNDTVTVSAAANYNSANVADAKLITVIYTISGASADNYNKPVNYTVAGTITKAAGAATSSQSGGNVTVSSKTANTITINTVNLSSTNPGNQTPEYAISTINTAPTSGWQDGTTFTGLTANTDYYVFARAKENANYQAGAAKASAKITTDILSTTISFPAPLSESKVYGTNFIKVLSSTGSGTGAISYSSSDTSIAAVDNSGAVTIKKAGGPVTITATKASDGTYAKATAEYTLTVTQLQLTITDPTVTTTRVYKSGDTTAAVTAGALKNVVSGDTVTVSAVANYNSANAADAYQITVVYTIDGASKDNYIKPANYTTSGTITKATGANTSGTNGTPTAASKTATSITSSTVNISSTNPGNQTIEYAISTTTTLPTNGWQDDKTFENLSPNTDYYIFARAKENTNYQAGAAKTSAKITTDKATIIVNIVKSGNTGSDNVTVSPASGADGTSVTLSYTLDKTNSRNRLTFSGTASAIAEVDSPGTGAAVTSTRTYVIKEADATENTITINAAFTHTALELNTIAFADTNNETKVYGSASFTKAITNTGSGSSAISYASSDTNTATVNNTTGAVTIANVGTTTITATKAADATYAQASASYTLTVTQLQLTKANPTVTLTKPYDGNTTAAVTAVGALNNKVGSDDVTVSAAANFNAETVADANKITIVYSISGAKAGNYIKPVDYTITTGCSITKATGGTITAVVTEASKTSTSITVNAVSVAAPNSGGQSVEYAVSTSTTAPSNGWQEDLIFSGLSNGSNYYIYARAKENANYKAGTAKQSARITLSLQANTIAFADTAETKVYGSAAFTKAITNTGSGTGAITYSSDNTGVATVNNTTGAVTIVKVGTAKITATKAADDTYAQATASYTLTVTRLQLTKANPTVSTTKTYDGNTSASVTADGALNNKVGSDDVTVSSVANYNSANVSEANKITVVYSIGGTSASNYIKPVDFTIDGTITKAAGGTVSGTVSAASTTSTGITVNSLTVASPNSGNQTVEYARATSATTPATGWQDGTTFSGLTANTNYYFFARAKANDNYQAGTAINAQIRTDLQANIIAFGDPLEESKVYGTNFTKALSSTGSGNGAVTYSSSDTSIAEVNNSGAVTIKKAGGPITITATKAANGVYAQATATYTLTITPLQLTIADPTIASKTYDGTTTVTVTAGALGNKKSGDTVNVSAVGNFNSANVATANQITVVYSISGANAGNYLKPVDSTVAGTINKAAGGTISGNVTMSGKTAASITVVAASITSPNSGNQTVEYAAATTNTAAPTTGWQDGTTLSGLTGGTDYYIYARAKENANYSAGTAKASSKITTDVSTNTIAFAAPLEESKVYGANFTKALSNTGSGNGAITYSSSDTSIATVNSSTGEVTPKKVGGPITITAKKEANGGYAQAAATYTLTITALQLTISNPTLTATKKYDGNTTAAVTKGTTVTGIKSGDTVTVNATANYASADVGTGKTITVVYTLSGSSAGNYLAPPDYSVTNGSINKADGGTVSSPTVASKTSTSITVNAVTAPSGQTVEYAAATGTTAPSSGWTDSTTISGLTANTSYYLYARSKANDNYNAGTAARTSSQTKTDAASAALTTVINFENDALNKTYDYTEGDNKPTSVKVVNDPINSGKKSLEISSNGPNSDKGYNQAAVIPVKLPYTVKDYESFSFKFSLVSGNTGTNLDSKQIQVYIAKDKATFKKWGFGNGSSESNQFAANLIGAAPSSAVNFGDTYKNKWTDYSITITSPGDAIKDLTGDLFIAIGINCKTNAVYLFDDITFTPKSGFTPPPPPPETPTKPLSPPSTGAVSSKNYRNMFTEYGYSSADVTAKVNNAWNKLFVNGVESGDNAERIYVETGSDMAYIHTFDSNDVRSEGMSYGMMMCVQMNDQTRFNKLWKWARTYMYNETDAGSNSRGYFSWQCSTSGSKMDKGPAPDGEEYFITALLFAHARWGSSSSGINNYAQQARQIIYDLTRRKPGNGDPYGEPSMFNTDNYMVRFATLGNSAKFTDPSYHLPAFYEVWALELQADYDNNKLYGIWSDKADLKKDIDFFKQAATTSRSFFAKTTNSTTGLGPDYAEFDGSPRNEGDHKHFEYDAWRIAMNIGMDYAWWAKDSWQKTFADRIQAFFVSKGVTSYGNRWELNGTQRGADHSPGLVGCNAVASLAATNVNAWKFIEDFWNISMTKGKYRYYDGCLYMMSMLHLSGNFKAYLSTNTTPANSSSITPTTASFDKKSGATNYKDIAVTVTLNGNTFANIKNGSTSLTSGTDYSSSGTTYTIKKEYLAKQAVGTTTLTFNFSGGASPELVVTITDSSNSSIDPTTATFDKKTGAQADIAVNVTLNGNTLSNIKNGNTNLTSGTDYTTSGSPINKVTIKKEYLAKQAIGTTTLTFDFSAGTDPTIAITVKDTTGGTAGTTYNFANDNLPNGYPKYSSSEISATITGGVLVVTKTGGYSTPKITLPFSVTGNLSGYTGIKINVKGVSGDFGNKVLYAAIGSTNLGSVNNAPIPNGSFGDVTIPISGGTNTGDLDISFWLNNTNAYVIEIKSIELVK